MKCDELKSTEIYAQFATEVYDDFGDSRQEQEYYRKEHVDAAIAELKEKLRLAEMAKDDAEAANTEYRDDIRKLKAENDRLDDLAHSHNLELLQKENIIAEMKDKIQDLKVIISQKEDAINKAVDIAFNIKKERDFTKRTLWIARSASAKFWANYWFDKEPSESIKYDRIGRMEGVEKEFILTKVTKHMTASDWVGLW